MYSIQLVSVLAAATSLLSIASADGLSSSSVLLIPSATKKSDARTMATAGCFSAMNSQLEDHGPGPFQTPGECQQICLGLEKDVLGLSDGNHCWCGDLLPPVDSKVDNSSCSTGCAGDKDNSKCGGKGKLWVMTTGHTLNDIDFFKPEAKSSSSSVPATTAAASASAASTVAVTATSTPTAAASKGPNTAGIAAGVVVGVLVLAAIIGGMFFFLRNKKRRDVEEEYRRQAAVNQFTAGGKQMHTSNSSMTDSRLDPDFLARRQSNGSIADNEDYSRRILKVTNA